MQCSRVILPDPEVDKAVFLKYICSYCDHEISDHEDTWPCPHCNEFAFTIESYK